MALRGFAERGTVDDARRRWRRALASAAGGEEERENDSAKPFLLSLSKHRVLQAATVEATTVLRQAQDERGLLSGLASPNAADGPRGPNAARALCKERLT